MLILLKVSFKIYLLVIANLIFNWTCMKLLHVDVMQHIYCVWALSNHEILNFMQLVFNQLENQWFNTVLCVVILMILNDWLLFNIPVTFLSTCKMLSHSCHENWVLVEVHRAQTHGAAPRVPVCGIGRALSIWGCHVIIREAWLCVWTATLSAR